jgi:hypothetical protein
VGFKEFLDECVRTAHPFDAKDAIDYDILEAASRYALIGQWRRARHKGAVAFVQWPFESKVGGAGGRGVGGAAHQA